MSINSNHRANNRATCVVHRAAALPSLTSSSLTSLTSSLISSLLLAALLLLTTMPARAIEPFIITDIRVEGAERLEAGTVFNYLPLKVGDELTDEEARLSIKELFATGFFRDVELEQDGTTLVVKVVERPSISEIKITGNKALDDAAIKQGLEQAGLVEGRILSAASLDRVSQEIENTYLSLGRYSAYVETEVEELERNRVKITLKISEGRVATIKRIAIIGAEPARLKILREQMSLSDKRGWRPFTRRNQYSKQKLEADLEAIRSYYLDRGFYKFELVTNTVEISANKQDIFLFITVNEGGRYVFGKSAFELVGAREEEIEVDLDSLDSLLTVVPGDSFSRKTVQADRAAIAARFADAGYAFVEVRPVYEPDDDAGIVTAVFAIEPKQRVYVRKIEITGNVFTRDQVVRRELRQFEGAWYSAAAVRRSRDRLRRLGYFSNVAIETPPVVGATDQVDMQVVVSESSTGSIAFSLGYSDTDGALYGLDYAQRNLLGTGRELQLDFESSQTTDSLELLYTNPYHTEDGVSRSIVLSQRRVDTDEADSAEYIVNAESGGLRYKIPIAENNSLNLGFNLEDFSLDNTSNTPREFNSVIEHTDSGINLLGSIGVSQDTRNDFFFPTRGSSRSLLVDFSVPGSEFEYYKISANFTNYLPVSDFITIKTSLGLGYGDSYGGKDEYTITKQVAISIPDEDLTNVAGTTANPNLTFAYTIPLDCWGDTPRAVTFSVNPGAINVCSQETFRFGLPFYRRYHAGGSSSVRGHDGRSLGPLSSGLVGAADCYVPLGEADVDTNPGPDYQRRGRPDCTAPIANANRETVGGDKRVLVNFEILFPPFGSEAGNDKRMGLFVDGGMVFGDGFDYDGNRIDGDIDLSEMRYSVGFLFDWLSPIGPFSMSYAKTLNEESGDDTQSFQITVGSVFR